MEPMGKLPTILTSLIVATILGFRAGLGISGVFCFFLQEGFGIRGLNRWRNGGSRDVV